MDTAYEVVTTLSSRGMSDADIARRTDSSQPTVWRLRTGKTKDCSADLYRKLCLLRDDTASIEPEAAAPARAIACATQSARLTADRRQLTRRDIAVDDDNPNQEAA